MRQCMEEMLDELIDMEGEVKIGRLTFSRSDILKEMDPIAYREALRDLVDSEIENFQYDIDHLDEETDADEIADLKQRIEDLQNI